MTPDEAHAEAVRRIAEAHETRAEMLDLGDLPLANLPEELCQLDTLQTVSFGFYRPLRQDGEWRWVYKFGRTPKTFTDLNPLAGLTSLTGLDLSTCKGVTDLSPLAGLRVLVTLGLSYCNGLTDLSPLAGPTALKYLDFSFCRRVADLTPLAGLNALTYLNLTSCESLNNLSPLVGLTALTHLDLGYFVGGADLSPLTRMAALTSLNLGKARNTRFDALRPLLARLEELWLYGASFTDLPDEVCGEEHDDNVLEQVRAYYSDLDAGAVTDAEVKLFVLGNGGVGKTQLGRRLCGDDYDEAVPSTHGV